MNTEETLYMNSGSVADTTLPQAQNPTPTPTRVKTGWKRVAIGGVSGIMIGAAGAYGASKLQQQSEADQADANQHDPIHDHPMAQNVTDDMTFAEAFAAARDEVGNGGVFTWHGNVYGTFTAEEWNALTPDEQMAYFQSINENMPQPEPQPEAVAQATAAPPQPQEVHVYHHVVNDQPQHQSDEYIATSGQVDTSDDDVRVVGEMRTVGTDEQGEINALPIETQGHKGVILGHEDAEIAVIDVDDSNSFNEPDIIIDLTTGESMTAGEAIAQIEATPDPGYTNAGYEEATADPMPDPMPDPDAMPMEDYMSDPGMDPGMDMATDVDVYSI